METWKEIDLNIKQNPIGRLLSCFWVLKVLMAVLELQPAPWIDVIMLGSGAWKRAVGGSLAMKDWWALNEAYLLNNALEIEINIYCGWKKSSWFWDNDNYFDW